ncbi:MAG: cob(I)yrinic acid a,c-diamide adenosyltransferase [Oscillospiraceae bacterium]|nr:cob(I)yrinic acid a,c-diamide adenosyltransferase [Oscillospiraceae bacterium]
MIEQAKKQVYFGDGKGKTTAAAGLCARALRYENRILFCSFFKDNSSGEMASLRKLGADVGCVKSPRFTWELDASQKAALKADVVEFFEKVKASAKDYDLIVLDEVLDAVAERMLDESSLLSFLEENPNTEIVMTGRNPSEALLGAVDYATEMKMIKHPFYCGLQAREGIEQ